MSASQFGERGEGPGVTRALGNQHVDVRNEMNCLLCEWASAVLGVVVSVGVIRCVLMVSQMDECTWTRGLWVSVPMY